MNEKTTKVKTKKHKDTHPTHTPLGNVKLTQLTTFDLREDNMGYS